MNGARRFLPILALALAAVTGCAADTDDDDGIVDDESEIRRTAATVTCKFVNVPAVYGDALDSDYELKLKSKTATGAIGSADNNPDLWTYKRKEGESRLYLSEEKLTVPPTVSHGKWRIVAGLHVPLPLVAGQGGKIKIDYWVAKGSLITPYEGSEQQRVIEERQATTIDYVEGTLLDRVSELANTKLTANCKP